MEDPSIKKNFNVTVFYFMVLFLINISAQNTDGLISCSNGSNKEAGYRRMRVDSPVTKAKNKIGKGKIVNFSPIMKLSNLIYLNS